MPDVVTYEAEPVLEAGADTGEGPNWDAAAGRLVWVDITATDTGADGGGRVHEYVPEAHGDRSRPVAQHVGAAVPTSDPDLLLLAIRDGFALLAEDGSVRMVAEVEADRPDCRMNDAKVDPTGRFWAGTMAYDQRPGAASLYRLDPAGSVTRVLTGLTLANGMGWSPDGRLMYFIDSPTGRVDVLDVDPGTGDVEHRRPLVQVVPGGGDVVPDGMTVDDEGFLWVAVFGAGVVHRYAPDGRLDAVVRVPVDQVTSCGFGGPGRDLLFVTTAAHGLDDAARAAQPSAGDLFVVEPGVTGPAAVPFPVETIADRLDPAARLINNPA
jgi:sugar lactone lactonase YvrE